MTLPALILVSLLALFALPLVSQMSGNPSPNASVRTQKQANKATTDNVAPSKDDADISA